MATKLLVIGSLYSEDPKEQRELDKWRPIDNIINWIELRLAKVGVANRVLIVVAETASGKSTTMPAEIHKFMRKSNISGGMICTQPRILTAIRNVDEIVKFYGMEKGKSIGWGTKESKKPPSKGGLLSATVGTLATQLCVMSDAEIMDKYRIIILDEVHTRDLPTDLTIYMLAQLLKRNENNVNCPFLILTSATLDREDYFKYFGIGMENFRWCRGRTFPITIHWTKDITSEKPNDLIKFRERTSNKYLNDMCATIMEIIRTADDEPNKADILCFVPGSNEGQALHELLDAILIPEAKEKGFPPSYLAVILYVDSESVKHNTIDYSMLDMPYDSIVIPWANAKAYRRIIISTNVAETGLTLNNLRYVVDSCYNRGTEFNPHSNCTALLTYPAQKNRSMQRRGRAGRKFPGDYFPMITQSLYEKTSPMSYPDIVIADITEIMPLLILAQLKAKHKVGRASNEVAQTSFSTHDIAMLTNPTLDLVDRALSTLYSIGIVAPSSLPFDEDINTGKQMELDRKNYADAIGLTWMGHQYIRCNETFGDVRNFRFFLASYSWEICPLDILASIALLASDDSKPFKKLFASALWELGRPPCLENKSADTIKNLFNDEFAAGLFILQAVKNAIANQTDLSAIHAKIKELAKALNVKYGFITSFLSRRDALIDAIIERGFSRGESLPTFDRIGIDELPNYITKFKHCIYDAYRTNALHYINGIYKTDDLMPVKRPSLISHSTDKALTTNTIYPKYVLYHKLNAMADEKTGIYTMACDAISVMDGYVCIDDTFNI